MKFTTTKEGNGGSFYQEAVYVTSLQNWYCKLSLRITVIIIITSLKEERLRAAHAVSEQYTQPSLTSLMASIMMGAMMGTLILESTRRALPRISWLGSCGLKKNSKKKR